MERTENHPFESFHYCPRCGARFVRHNEKAYHCEGCGFVYYFNPSAATVAVIVNERDELLVCVRAKEPAKGTLDLPGGFCDMHESAEEGVAREVLEETGMRVTETKYLFSLPNTYLYSGFVVHTIDAFFLCSVPQGSMPIAHDDVAEIDDKGGKNDRQNARALCVHAHRHHLAGTRKNRERHQE